MSILGGIPVLFFLATAAALLPRRCREGAAGVRESLLIAAVVFGMWVVTGTEVMSYWHRLSAGPVIVWWAVPTAAMAAGSSWSWRCWRPADRLSRAAGGERDWPSDLCIGGVVLVLLVTGIVAAVTPPNNADSHLYHLPRQIYWIQQGSVEHYPTPIPRQVMMPPMAEFVGTHFLLLSGGDHWANLIQWFALGMTALAATLIARELGAAVRGQSLAALLVVTDPTAAMQAMNAKNDLVLSLWTCAAAYFVLSAWTRRGCPPDRALLLGASFGLALLTKGTAIPYLVPLIMVAGLAIIAHERRWISAGVTIVLVGLALNAGHFGRNLGEFGSPFASPRVEYRLSNQTLSPAVLASNVVRNLMLHAGTRSRALNRALGSATIRFHRWIGIDPNDRRTTYAKTQFVGPRMFFAEDSAPAPLHLALAVAVVPVLLWRHRRAPLLAAAALTTGAMFVLFCAVFKWQPWLARLHLPVVTLFAAVAGAFLGRARPIVVAGIAAAALFVVAPSLLWGRQKPLLGTPSIFTATWEENILRTEPQLLEPLRCTVEAARRIAPRSVGIIVSNVGWEYLVQRALLRGLDRQPRFVPSSSHPDLRPRRLEAADLIIRINGPRENFRQQASATSYVAVDRCGPYTLYVPLRTAAASPVRRALPLSRPTGAILGSRS